MNPFTLFRFVINMQPVVAGVCLAQLLYVRKLAPARLEGVGPENAKRLAENFVDGLSEGRFGFPSGVFFLAKSDDDRVVVADEFVSYRSHLVALFKAGWDFSLAFGFWGVVVGGIALFILGTLLFPALLGELAAKRFLKSRIRAVVAPLPGGAGSEVAFETRGPCAHLLESRLRSAFSAPVLPARIASAAGIAPVRDAA